METCKNDIQYKNIPDCSNSSEYNPSIPMTIKNNERQFCLPSYPTSTFLYNDIHTMIEKKQRANKLQKDISRITMLDSIKNENNGNLPDYPNPERIYTIQNIKCNNEKNLMKHYRDFESKIVNIMIEIKKYMVYHGYIVTNIVNQENVSELINNLSIYVEQPEYKKMFIEILGSIKFSSKKIIYKSPHNFVGITKIFNDVQKQQQAQQAQQQAQQAQQQAQQQTQRKTRKRRRQ
jgi:hypothetical protein